MDTLQQVISEAVNTAMAEQMSKQTASPIVTKKHDKGEKISGIRGLAAYLGSSTSTAQSIKNSGRLPYYNIGAKVFFYSNEVDAALRTPSKSEMQ